LTFVQSQALPCKMKEARHKLSLSFENVTSIKHASEILEKFSEPVTL